MRYQDTEKKLKSCEQRCEQQLSSCLDGNSKGSCQVKYNRCRIDCGDL